RRPSPARDAAAVYVPSCLNTMFAPADGGPGVMIAFARLATRAGVKLHVPEGVGGLCCGTPWSSKGFTDGQETMAAHVRDVLLNAPANGRLPVTSAAASCTEGFHRLADAATGGVQRPAEVAGSLRVMDAVAYTAEYLLPRLTVRRRLPSLALHPTCSS